MHLGMVNTSLSPGRSVLKWRSRTGPRKSFPEKQKWETCGSVGQRAVAGLGWGRSKYLWLTSLGTVAGAVLMYEHACHGHTYTNHSLGSFSSRSHWGALTLRSTRPLVALGLSPILVWCWAVHRCVAGSLRGSSCLVTPSPLHASGDFQ